MASRLVGRAVQPDPPVLRAFCGSCGVGGLAMRGGVAVAGIGPGARARGGGGCGGGSRGGYACGWSGRPAVG